MSYARLMPYWDYDAETWYVDVNSLVSIGMKAVLTVDEEWMYGAPAYFSDIARCDASGVLAVNSFDEVVLNCFKFSPPRWTVQSWIDGITRFRAAGFTIPVMVTQAAIEWGDAYTAACIQCSDKSDFVAADAYGASCSYVMDFLKGIAPTKSQVYIARGFNNPAYYPNLTKNSVLAELRIAQENNAAGVMFYFTNNVQRYGAGEYTGVDGPAWAAISDACNEFKLGDLDLNHDGQIGPGDIVKAIETGQESKLPAIEEEILKK